MGSFRDIVRSRRGREGLLREFRLGFKMPKETYGLPAHEVIATFAEQGSQPVIRSWRYAFDSGSFLEFRNGNGSKTTVAIRNYETSVDVSFEFADFWFLSSSEEFIQEHYPDLTPIADFLSKLLRRGKGRRRRDRRRLTPELPPLVPVAPLRAKPRRTYDPIRETATPEGTHVPMLMMRLEHAEGKRWKSLREDLVAFGKASGLFSDIRVRRHGRQISDPFQLQVKVHSGSHANIMDVGYGISQSLPILVELLTPEVRETEFEYGMDEDSLMFLLQQPEVHLHPRGQAELASFLVNSVKKRGHQFLIETHSDHIVDRIRISVMKKLLDVKDVSLLYFEPTGNSVTIRNLELDEYGNIRNAPAGYRDFFMRETEALLGLGG